MALKYREIESPEGMLTFKFENTIPISLEDFSVSLIALAQQYEEYVIASGAESSESKLQLYVHEIRSGSIIAVLKAISEQGHLLFGEHGAVSTIKAAFEHSDTIIGFMGGINDVIQYFLGASSKEPPTKKTAEQIVKFLEPVAKDQGSNLVLQFIGPVKIDNVTLNYNSQQANAVQNRARRYLGPAIPSNEIRRDELLTLSQVRGKPKARAGDRGVIESISKSEVKLLISSEEIKKEILDAPENPFQRVFIVDVEVKTVDGKPALYKILDLKDSFDKP